MASSRVNILPDSSVTTELHVNWFYIQIWRMATWMLGKLREGYTMVSAREGDYRYTYFLWFENLLVSEPSLQSGLVIQ